MKPIDAYLETCGQGTAWIGSMIRESMVRYGEDLTLDLHKKLAERELRLRQAEERYETMRRIANSLLEEKANAK